MEEWKETPAARAEGGTGGGTVPLSRGAGVELASLRPGRVVVPVSPLGVAGRLVAGAATARWRNAGWLRRYRQPCSVRMTIQLIMCVM